MDSTPRLRAPALLWLAALLGCGSAPPAPPTAPAPTTSAIADRDLDQLADDLDACPDAPEDVDGWDDDDGCPDPDNDGDGVPDVDDLCPFQAGARSGDAGGCPIAGGQRFTDGPPGDLDDDGYPDEVDACPEQPETFPSTLDGGCTDDGDGCPDGGGILLVACDVVILERIYFEAGDGQPPSSGLPIIDAIADVLHHNPGIHLAVVGHTDDAEPRALASTAPRRCAPR
ncbi:MAG: hypothetical protein R2939_04500 [Kofleriaceae bacterium]